MMIKPASYDQYDRPMFKISNIDDLILLLKQCKKTYGEDIIIFGWDDGSLIVGSNHREHAYIEDQRF